MGIKTFIQKQRQKKEIAKAIEKGKQLSDSGQQQVATTSGYVNVPAKPTDTGQSYNVEKPKENNNGGGGGGVHNGGGSSGGSSNTNQQSTLLTPTQGATVNQQSTKQQSFIRKALSKINTPINNLKPINNNLYNVNIKSSGGVKVGNKTYSGNAYIKELGMTANAYRQAMREKLIREGQLEKKNSGSGRWSVKSQTGEETLQSGDKIIYNKFGDVVGVRSEFFGKSMSLENYDKLVKKYEGTIAKKDEKKVYGTKGEYTLNGRDYTASGKPLYSGEVSAVTPEDVMVVASGGAGLAKLGVKKGLTFTLSSLITKPANVVYEKYTPQPKTNVGKFAKASITGLAITRSPLLAEAYLADITKALITKPGQVVKSAWENKAETAGFIVGGGLLGKGLNLAELQFRGIKVEKVNLPKYGEVIIQKIPKYKDIVWVKGAMAQTEKLAVMEQINRIKGNKERVFVQVSPKGIPSKVFSNTKNLGFETVEVSNPMRGLYQAPPMKFLEKYKDIINTNYGAASYYAGGSGRRTILPNPLDLLRSKVSDTFSTQRPAEYIERTYKEVNTPDWIKETSQSLEQGKGIPKKYQEIYNKLYKRFLETPSKFNGKDYIGLEKQKLVNNLNLKGKGNGVKLKVYAALLEYQNKNKVKLAGGAENLSQILPYGAESQIVRALGTRFFEKSIKDLRKGVKPSISRKIIELITGTKRGQKVAMIDGQMVEIYPVRSFDRTNLRRTKVKSEKFKQEDVSDKLVKDILGERRREGGRNITPPRPLLLRENIRNIDRRTRPINRIDNLLTPTRDRTREERPRTIIREVPRRPERPRTIIREVPRRPERPRPNPPRRPEPPKEIIRNLGRDEKPILKKGKNIRKKTDYLTMPTIFEQLSGGVRKGERAKGRVSGFEAMRFQ
jgi:hypothetical protein